MSNADESTPYNAADCPIRQEQPTLRRLSGTRTLLGEGMEIQRFLPTRQLRMIGAWTFLDHIGPADIGGTDGVRVGPHPHTGLQTFTWMIEGEMLHRDSLGSVQMIRPGQVNLMTAGKGISHSEESPSPHPAGFHAVQLWIALPDDQRFIEPAFAHHPELPRTQLGNVDIVVMAGKALGLQAPPKLHSPMMGVELCFQQDDSITLPLNPDFEHGILLLSGSAALNSDALSTAEMLYLGRGTKDITLQGTANSRVLVIGGEPFGEDVLMWWNFLGRSKDEITDFVQRWNAGADFGTVTGYPGARLQAPVPPWAK